MKSLIEIEHSNFFQTYKRLPIEIEKAEGARIYDKEGGVWLDFLGGIAVNALGHSHPAVIQAVCNQAKRYMHVSNYFYQDIQIELAAAIKDLSGYDRVFYSNSGTEATDGAIKLVRKWAFDKNKTEIIALSGGFHGRTYGALSIMDKPLYKENMGPYLDNTKVIKHNDIEELKANINEKTAAIFLEFIQGEGGIVEVSPEYVNELKALKSKYGFLIVADEIQAGVARSGKFFAFEHYDIKPDIITMAKGLGGGMPLGAIIAKEELADVWTKGNHGTTYGGNAVACAAGLAVMNEIKNGLMENVNQVGDFLKSELIKLKDKYPDHISEVRGKGLMLGLALRYDATFLLNELLTKKIIANAASFNVLRIVPPLIINKEDAKEFVDALDSIFANLIIEVTNDNR